MREGFSGKVAVVTGAAGGMGRVYCESLCRRGAEVWAWDVNREGLDRLEQWAREQGFPLHAARVDVADHTQVDNGLEAILTTRRRVEVWINNAGIGVRGPFKKSTLTELARIVDVNLNGVLHGTRTALAHMEKMGGGVIVNMASVAGFLPGPYLSLYSATKHAVVGFTRAVREELRQESCPTRLVLVAPGFVDTPMIGEATGLPFPEWLKWAVSKPEPVIEEVLDGVARGREEIFPTWNGRILLKMYSYFPRATQRSTKILMAKRFKDLWRNRVTPG